ncbi:MAG: hypothetical protein WEB90_06055 [Gemmatimonadota bacterium]
MTVRAIAGVVALNVFLFGVGASVLWGLRGWRWWTDLVRLAGVAYLLGVAALSVSLTLELVVGVPIDLAAIVLTGVALAAAALVTGVLRGLRPPGLDSAGWRPPRLTVFVALFVAAIVVYFEALFRSARLQPLSEWDAWWVWTLRAKAIFHFGELGDETFVPHGVGASYPPGLSLLEAAAFHAMGSTDVVTLHLLYWFLAAGFVVALAGLLTTRVRPTILYPFLLLVLVMPSFTDRVTDGRADLPLAYLAALGALLVLLWLEERQFWQLAAGSLLLSGAMLTKREGLLLAACIFLAAFVTSWGDRRRAWPLLAGSAIVAVAISLPWRIWFITHGLPSDVPKTGYGLLDQLDRAFPSFRLVVRTLFDYDLWLLLPVLAVVAIVLAAISRTGRTAVFPAVFLAAAIVGSSWVIWSNPDYPITQDYGLTPIVRLVGDAVLVLGALTPFVLERAFSRSADGTDARAPSAGIQSGAWARTALPWALLFIAVLGYPASMLAGTSAFRLPGGFPSFPSPTECTQPPVEGEKVRVVFGYERTYAEANVLRRRVATVSQEAEIAQDGCGRLRVFVDDLPSPVGRRILDDAREAGFSPALERDAGG